MIPSGTDICTSGLLNEYLRLSAENELRAAKLHRQLACEAMRERYQSGYTDGYERAQRHLEDEWPAVVRPIRRITEDDSPTHTELEERRWGPGGRAHFADPRPGDYVPVRHLRVVS